MQGETFSIHYLETKSQIYDYQDLVH